MNETVNRAGAKTSEFWFGMATVGLILVNGLEAVSIPESHIMLVAGLAGAYGVGRTVLKNSLAKNGGIT